MLESATSSPAHPLRTPVVAGAGPDARIMVLRSCDRLSATLDFHTDRRSPKVAALACDPRVAIIGYDPGLQLQLRLKGQAEIVSDSSAMADAWALTSAGARRNYATINPPGSFACGATDGTPADMDDTGARNNFALFRVSLDSIEWLTLTSPGHRRASYIRTGADWTAHWLTP